MDSEKILEKFNLNYKDLEEEEQKTLERWIDTVKKNQLTVDKVREYVSTMRESVEKDLSEEPSFIRVFLFKVANPKLVRLQARLHNYILLEAMLSTPEKAQKALERALEGVVRRI